MVKPPVNRGVLESGPRFERTTALLTTILSAEISALPSICSAAAKSLTPMVNTPVMSRSPSLLVSVGVWPSVATSTTWPLLVSKNWKPLSGAVEVSSWLRSSLPAAPEAYAVREDLFSRNTPSSL